MTPNELAEAHLWLVPAVIRQMPRTPMDADDVAAAGRLGLVCAALAFDETRGVPFRLYADSRIRGAIQDAMRRDDWLPRAERALVRAGAKSARVVVSFDAPANDGHPLRELVADPTADADTSTMTAETAIALCAAINRLPARTGLAVTRRYLHGVNYAHIGVELGITESGAAQLCARGLDRLRRTLVNDEHGLRRRTA